MRNNSLGFGDLCYAIRHRVVERQDLDMPFAAEQLAHLTAALNWIFIEFCPCLDQGFTGLQNAFDAVPPLTAYAIGPIGNPVVETGNIAHAAPRSVCNCFRLASTS